MSYRTGFEKKLNTPTLDQIETLIFKICSHHVSDFLPAVYECMDIRVFALIRNIIHFLLGNNCSFILTTLESL